MNMILWTKRYTLNSTGKVEANRISTMPSNIRGNNNTTNGSRIRWDTCNSKIDLKLVLIQISKLIILDLRETMRSIKVRGNMLTLAKGRMAGNSTNNKTSIINKTKDRMDSSIRIWTKIFLKMTQTCSNSWMEFQEVWEICQTTIWMGKGCQVCRGCPRWIRDRTAAVTLKETSKIHKTSSICQVLWAMYKICSTISKRIQAYRWILTAMHSTGNREVTLSNRTFNTQPAIKEEISNSSSMGCQQVQTEWICQTEWVNTQASMTTGVSMEKKSSHSLMKMDNLFAPQKKSRTSLMLSRASNMKKRSSLQMQKKKKRNPQSKITKKLVQFV